IFLIRSLDEVHIICRVSGEVAMVYSTIIPLLAIFNIGYKMDVSQVKSINNVFSNSNPSQTSYDYKHRTIVFGDVQFC
ncbi:MAG TPA: hypothetical protein VEL11_04820, partial [Candidatus Bathyarchaeia archaeon]|nr:hypothetical protein [Candidatus Bathyarchaeia archaeon]